MSELQRKVQETIDQLVESGAETGLQVAVYQDGRQVVDAVAGADAATGSPITSGTLIYSSSAGKALTSAVVHVLVERGVFGYDTPIAEVWPEFAAKGKDKATIRHALTHTLGTPGVPADTTPDDLVDWDKMVAALADAEPWWEPGTKTGYHAQTFGWLLGETVRRATGKPISQVLKEEVATPLGVADELFLGVPASHLDKVAPLVQVGDPVDLDQLEQWMPTYFKAVPKAVQLSVEMCNRRDYLGADIPAGGTFSARAIAKLYAALLGEVDGVRLISAERLREVSAVAVDAVDEIFGHPTQYALGFGLGRPVENGPDPSTVLGWPGAGGTHADMDLSSGTTFALTKTRFSPGDYSAVAAVSEVITKAGAPV
ncbi:serine hydrolase [Microbispora sp. H11081]|uniref:serine hydrolase domain-containing protein n=1 Tax=Microbispora sp. H11081 TaxID=2729107 RepID=UPI00147671E8|nr:serine hydrolase domain-containing protein [Microbispora sp. H11081]